MERLLAAWRAHADGGSMFDALKNAICAVELHRDTFQGIKGVSIALVLAVKDMENNSMLKII